MNENKKRKRVTGESESLSPKKCKPNGSTGVADKKVKSPVKLKQILAKSPESEALSKKKAMELADSEGLEKSMMLKSPRKKNKKSSQPGELEKKSKQAESNILRDLSLEHHALHEETCEEETGVGKCGQPKMKAVNIAFREHKNTIKELLLCLKSNVQSLEKLGAKRTAAQDSQFHHLNLYISIVCRLFEACESEDLHQIIVETTSIDKVVKLESETDSDKLMHHFQLLLDDPDIRNLFMGDEKVDAQLKQAITLSASELVKILLQTFPSDSDKHLKWYSDKLSYWLHRKADDESTVSTVLQGLVAVLSQELLALACQRLIEIVWRHHSTEAIEKVHSDVLMPDASKAIKLLARVVQLLNQDPLMTHTLPTSIVERFASLSISIPDMAGFLKDILQKFPLCAATVGKEIFCHHLDEVKSQNASQELVILLLKHNFACQDWLAEWLECNDKVFKKTKKKWALLPVVKHCLFMDRVTYAPVVENIRNQYFSSLCKWIKCQGMSEAAGTDDALHEDKLELLQCLIRHNSHQDKLEHLWNDLCSSVSDESLPNASLGLAQFTVLATLIDQPTLSSKSAKYFAVCIQGLLTRLSHKAKRSKEAEHFLIEKLLENSVSLPDEAFVSSIFSWKQLVMMGLKNHFKTKAFLSLLAKLVPDVFKNNKTVNFLDVCQLHQMVLGHSAFLPVMFDDDMFESKEALVDLQIALVDSDESCCETKHISFLLGAYGASCSNTDKKLLLLLQKYEANSCSFSSFKPYLWGLKAVEHYSLRKSADQQLLKAPSSMEVMEILDEDKMLQSALTIPLTSKVQTRAKAEPLETSSCYDIDFLLPLFSHLLATENLVDCRKFVETNCLGYTFAALSCHSDSVRGAAYHILANFYDHLEGARGFAEKHQVLYILNALRNSIETENAKVPCVITIFLAKAAALMLRPEDHMYQMVNSYLLLKPALDLGNVPEFYKLFNSAAMEYKQERTWLLTLLLRGLRETQDYHIFEKRYTFKLILGFHDSALSDKHTKGLVLKIVQQACSIRSVASDLSKNHAILSWLTGAIQSSGGDRNSLPLLVDICHTLWFTMLDGRDEEVNSSSSRSPCLPVLFTNETLLTVLQLLQSARRFPTWNSFQQYLECLGSICKHVKKTEKHLVVGGGHSVMSVKLTDRDILLTLWHWALLKHDATLKLEVAAILKNTQDVHGEILTQKIGEDGSVMRSCIQNLQNLILCWKLPNASTLLNESEETDSHMLTSSFCTFLVATKWSLQNVHKSGDAESLIQILQWLESWILDSVHVQNALLADASQPLLRLLFTSYGLLNSASSNETNRQDIAKFNKLCQCLADRALDKKKSKSNVQNFISKLLGN